MSLSYFAAGLGLGLSLIVAIGAQNAFLLRQGLRREHVMPVVIVCAASDIALYAVGATGFGAITQTAPWLIEWVRWVGAAFIIGYGLLAARRALRPQGQALRAPSHGDGADPSVGGVDLSVGGVDLSVGGVDLSVGGAEPSGAVATLPAGRVAVAPVASRRAVRGVVLTALALTWLNPHVYLDTVFLAGSVASAQGPGRWMFVVGASVASIAWFTALGYGARGLGRWLSSPRAWRILDGVIALTMVAIGISLVV